MTLKTQNALNSIDLKKILSLVILICIISCSNVQEREEPENLILKDKMIEIYTDMILLDAVQRTNSQNFKSYELESSEHIYNKYKIDSTTLSQNIEYYNLDFDANSEIYEKVKLNIEQRNQFIDSVTKARDSIKKAKTSKRNAELKDSIQTKKKVKQKLNKEKE